MKKIAGDLANDEIVKASDERMKKFRLRMRNSIPGNEREKRDYATLTLERNKLMKSLGFAT